MKVLKIIFSGIVIILNCSKSISQNCPNSGSHIQSANENTYYPGTQATVAAGATSITLGAIGSGLNFGNTPISVGDILLIIQMQGAQFLVPSVKSNTLYGGNRSGAAAGMVTTNLQAGNMEFVIATNAVSISGGTLTISAGLTNGYSYSAYGINGQYTYQVIRVPTYFNIQIGTTVNTPLWNGSTGGVTIINAVNQLDFNGQTINAIGAGFRGGGGRSLNGQASVNKTDYYDSATSTAHASKAEGIAGTPRYIYFNNAVVDNLVEGYPGGSFARGAPANAGGGACDNDPLANDQNAGGGGGGNGGAGGLGGAGWYIFGFYGGHGGDAFQTWNPSTTYCAPNRLIMGGGGGAGSSNNASGTPGGGAASSGSSGGGLIIINASVVINAGVINASGATTNNTVTTDGSGGGGAGGSILIHASSGVSGISAIAEGAKGGSNTTGIAQQFGPGGGGGGGVIYSSNNLNSFSVNGGDSGISYSTATSGAFASLPGSLGIQLQNINVSQLPKNQCVCQLNNSNPIPGIITPSSMTIVSGTSPGTLISTPASGGACGPYDYKYQWQNSTDGINYTNIPSATSLSFAATTLTLSTYYRIRVNCVSDTVYSSPILITIGNISTTYNYIRTRNINKAGVLDSATAAGLTSPFDVGQVTQYFDGLGRKVQTVLKKETPLQNDLVSVDVYDNFGRESIMYLPYAASTNDGNFKSSALTDQSNFNSVQFPNEQYYFGEITFESSLRNLPLASAAPGMSWVGSDRNMTAQYLVSTVGDSVQEWSINSVQNSLPFRTGPYAAGQLSKNVSADEKGNQQIEYKDKMGKTILKKIQSSALPSSGHAGWLCTYYVYDSLQNLRFVIQPQAIVLINGSWSVSQALADELCFRYEYDGRRRLIIKKVPGSGQVWMVYDARDRLAMQQDSALRNQKKWMFIKYDAENRPDSAGLITDNSNYNNLSYHENLAYSSTNYPTVASYTNELLTQRFYDDYSWVSTYGAPVSSTMATNYTANSNYFITSYNTSPSYAVSVTPQYITRGMPTGSMKKVIGTTSQYLYSVNFYDDRGRSIQTQSVNYTGAIDTATIQYNFVGAVLRTLLSHKKNGNTSQTHIIVTKMDYDHVFRLRHIYKNIDNAATDQIIDSIQYNELGQLRAKYLGNSVDSLIYDYNIRGWLTGINKNYVAGTTNHFFGMELGYDKALSAAPGNMYTTQEYNGMIEGTVWKSAGSGTNRKYDYVYDNANRLTAANFTQYNGSGFDLSAAIDFTANNLSYDANGNILTMNQKGFLLGGSNLIDQLKYTYQTNSNKLTKVYDSADNAASLLGDFHYNPATKQSTDYNYDGNGNLTLDNNKAISNIHYNFLNFPDSISFAGKGYIKYVYDATGTKLQKTTVDSVGGKKTMITYVNGFVYQNTSIITGSGTDTLQFIAHEEGRIRWAYHKFFNGTTAYKFEYDFFEKDHLGNTRMILTQQRDTSNYLASMESVYRSTETKLFANITNTSYPWSSVPGNTGIPSGTKLLITNPNDSVSKVDFNGTSGQKMGPSLLLKVMSGDTVSMAVQSFYNSNSITTTNNSLTDVLSSLATGLMNTSTGPQKGGTLAGFTSNTGPVYAGLNSFLSTKDPAPPSGYPKAYLNWILLDDQFNYVSSSSGSVQAASTTYPAATLNTVAPGTPLVIPRNGYLYVWVSNETQGWDVFFDNLSVQYKQGPLLEENHYYPYGLTMAGISDMAIKTNYAENKFRYNQGTELQNKEFSDGSGWEMYETSLRSYDPQLGRFGQSDPLAAMADCMSVYQYAGDNPALFNDPSGAFRRKSFTFSPLNDGTAFVQSLLDQQNAGGFIGGGSSGDGASFNNLADAINSTLSSASDNSIITLVNNGVGDWEPNGEVNDVSDAHYITDKNGNTEISYTYGYGGGDPTETGDFHQDLSVDYVVHGVINMFGMDDPNDTQVNENYTRGAIGGPVPYYGNFTGPGPDGPRANPFKLIGYDGKILKPIDMIDAAAQRHDYAYWILKASGIHSALWDDRLGSADRSLAESAIDVILKYNNGINDSITNQAISSSEYNEAKEIVIAFGLLGGLKFIGNLFGR